MSIRYSYHIGFVALLLLLAACTKDELADDARLPEGQYPLQIAAATLSVEGGEAQPWGAPQTRVSETEDGMGSKWDGDEEIGVQIEGSTETATYIVHTGGTVTSNAPLYWSDRDDHTVNAWYSTMDGTIDLRDQTNGLAYLLHGTGTGDYQTPVTLIFTHRLAKVRVTPSSEVLSEVQSLQLYTYTQCTHNQGNDVQGAQEGWIEMMPCTYTDNGTTITCWEANVVPSYEITKLMANNDGEVRTLSAAINPVAGSFYNITLNNDKGYTDDGNGNYTVTTAEGLKAVADIANSGSLDINITLDKDINLTGITWTPIGIDFDHQYTGTFDGGGHTITGLTMTGSNENAGLFGYIGKDGGTVKNVVLKDVQITSNNQYANVGGMAGINNGTIENCSVSGGSVSGYSAGGVVGQQYSGSITLCNSSATVQGTSQVGGVVGYTNYGVTLTACYATGDVTAKDNDTAGIFFAGGVVGSNGGNLTACYATGDVTGGTGSIYVGGVTGSNDSGTLTACYHATGTVSGPVEATGGVTGRNYNALGAPVITACYWGSNPNTGIGENQAGTTDGTTQVDSNWTEAMKAMNTALSGTDWKYVSGSGSIPLTLEKQ